MINPVREFSTPGVFSNLTKEHVKHIIDSLDIRSLCRLESTHVKGYALTEYRWKQLRTSEPYTCEWSFLENNIKIDKWQYILTKLFFRRVFQDMQENPIFKPSKACKMKKDNAFEWIEKQPKLLPYLKEHFPLLASCMHTSQHGIVTRDPSLFGENEQKLVAAVQKKEWGGDLLLLGLFEARALDLNQMFTLSDIKKVFDCFQRAVNQGVKGAGLIALHAVYPFTGGIYTGFECWSIINQEIQQTYYNTLEFLLEYEPSKNRVPFAVLKLAGRVKFGCDELSAARDFFEKAYAKNRQDLGVLNGLQAIACKQKRFEAAGNYSMQALQLAGPHHRETARILESIAYMKYNRGKYKEADEFFTQAIQAYQDRKEEPPNELWKIAAKIKIRLNDLSAATYEILKKVHAKDSQNTQVLNRLILIAKAQNRLEEAEHFCMQAVSLCPHDLERLEDAANTKYELKKFEEARSLYRQVIRAYQEKHKPIPEQVLKRVLECANKKV